MILILQGGIRKKGKSKELPKRKRPLKLAFIQQLCPERLLRSYHCFASWADHHILSFRVALCR